MIKTVIGIIGIILTIILFSCKIETSDNYDVKYLFTIENIKVFRFYDNFSCHYFIIGENGKIINDNYKGNDE